MKRPKIISVICLWGFISVLYTFPQVFSPVVKKLGILIPALYGIMVALYFIACVGLWYLKRWGVQLYLYAFFSKTLFNILNEQMGGGFYFNLFASIVFIIVLIRYYPKLNPDL
jgi:hypothetical protein